MAAAERIFMAKESTSQEILSNTKSLIDAGKEKPKRYGMRINNADSNPATRVTYLFDAAEMTPAAMNFTTGWFDYGDWGEIWFVKENRPVMVKNDGTVAYELNHNNHALKMDGTASDITNTSFAGNAMSEIPLVWVKRYSITNYDYVIFCKTQYDNTYKAYAHTDASGSVLPVTYFPMYEGAVISSRMRSLSGQTPTANQTDAQESTAAKQNGARWDKTSFSECNLMYEMCTLISRSTNSQAKFGQGRNSATDYLKTGTTNGLGQFYGYNTATNGVKMFYCENFFGNYWKRVTGLLYVGGKVCYKAVPPYNSVGTGYVNTGFAVTGTTGGYISKMVMTDAGRLLSAVSGSETTFECDGGWFLDGETKVALFGGNRGSGLRCGLSCWHLNDVASDVHASFVASLSCKPPVVA